MAGAPVLEAMPARQTHPTATRSANPLREGFSAANECLTQGGRRTRIMPLVRIDLIEGKSAEYRKTLGEIVYRAMREVINVPENDKFQIITEHPPEGLNVADNYLGNTYSRDIVLIQITMNAGRSVEMKKAFFKRIADDIHAQLKLRRDDVVINLVECVKENWSFGGGIAQYAE
jgi:phenylpyruvate tautomerase PptA (4-oxalocrotonate tautomerase family)